MSFSAYQILERQNDLTVRISDWAPIPLPDWKRLGSAGVRADFGNENVQMGALKSFADGSLGSTTAWFFEPYTDAPNTSGIPSPELLHPDEMYERMRDADKAGLQVAVHAIGDRANRTILDMFERLENENGPADRRLRIEHAQHLSPVDIPRFAKLKVIASVQPYHAIDDGRWADKRIRTGTREDDVCVSFRCSTQARFWRLARRLPVRSNRVVPLQGIYAAATRRTLDREKHPDWMGAGPENFGCGSRARYVHRGFPRMPDKEERNIGSLEPGKLADLAVLSEDILHINPVDIQNAKVDMTIFDGRVVFERK